MSEWRNNGWDFHGRWISHIGQLSVLFYYVPQEHNKLARLGTNVINKIFGCFDVMTEYARSSWGWQLTNTPATAQVTPTCGLLLFSWNLTNKKNLTNFPNIVLGLTSPYPTWKSLNDPIFAVNKGNFLNSNLSYTCQGLDCPPHGLWDGCVASVGHILLRKVTQTGWSFWLLAVEQVDIWMESQIKQNFKNGPQNKF